MSARSIVIVAFPGVQPLDVVGPHEVFAGANAALDGGRSCRDRDRTDRRPYRIEVVSADGANVVTESGLQLGTSPLPVNEDPIDTLLLPGGTGVTMARFDGPLISWVQKAASRSRRIATVCSGTFLAAQAGLLDGRTVTTHWAPAAQLAADYPAITVDPDPIYRHDGNIWSSAGVTAGIDLSLALVDADHGAEVSQTVARWLVMFLHRPGGQTQFATATWTPRAERSHVRRIQQRIDDEPGADHSVSALAAVAAMSPRHFTRVFTDEVGVSPGRYVERVRIEAARRLLETSNDTLDIVAQRCGFGTAETLRRSFHRGIGVAPDHYRQRFRRN